MEQFLHGCAFPSELYQGNLKFMGNGEMYIIIFTNPHLFGLMHYPYSHSAFHAVSHL
jgi:hypothetical protein